MFWTLKITFALSLLATGAFAQSWEAWTTPNSLNLRAGHPGSYEYSQIVTGLPYCAKLTISKCSAYGTANWCSATWQDKSGWVAQKYISRSNAHCVVKVQEPKKTPSY